MSEEEQIIQQIEKAECAHNMARTKNLQKEEHLASLENQISLAQSQVESIIVPKHQFDIHNISNELVVLKNLLLSLESQVLQENSTRLEAESRNKSEISQLKGQQKQLMLKLESNLKIDQQQLRKLQKELSALQQMTHDQLLSKEQEEKAVDEQEIKFRSLAEQIQKISITQVECAEKELTRQRQQHSDYQFLEKELIDLQAELKNVETTIKQSEKQFQSKVGSIKDQIQQQKLKIQRQNENLQHLISIQQSLKTKYSQQCLVLAEIMKGNEKLQRQISQLQQLIQGQYLSSEIDLRQNKQKRQTIKQEDERIAKEQKNAKNRKNYKELIRAEQREFESLQRSKSNEENIYNSTLKTKNTYSSKESLDILQKELRRHINPKIKSVESLTVDLEKLQRTNKQLKDNIKRLNRLSQEYEAKEQKLLNEAQKKRDLLLNDKSETDKTHADISYKLGEFLKRFPNYQAEKQDKKQKLKKTDSIVIKEKSPKTKKTEKPSEDEQFIILDDNMPETELQESAGSTVFKKTKWYKRRSSIEDQIPEDKPIYQNHYFQAAIGLILALVATILIS